MHGNELVLGVDGGGSKTIAWLAMRTASDDFSVVGRGSAGSSNVQGVGSAAALANLDAAIGAAFVDAEMVRETVAAAALALAGSDREATRQSIAQWAEECRLAGRTRIVHDALPVLAAGTPDGWGVALISGTGSLCFGRTRDGDVARSGGWGYLFGDEGSGYGIAVAALRAAAQASDGRGPSTALLDAFLQWFERTRPEQLIAAVYGMASDRAAIAASAQVVTVAAAGGDPVAGQILDDAAGELALMVAAVARKLDLGAEFPLALAGGVLLSCAPLAHRLHDCLNAHQLNPSPVQSVLDPVAGAIRMAMRQAS